MCSAVSTEYRSVTDGQTDRQTDMLRQHSPRYAYVSRGNKSAQEAQLSQRDRATLRVIEYFAKSLKVTHSR